MLLMATMWRSLVTSRIAINSGGEAALRDATDTILLVRDAVQRDEMPNARLLEVQQGFGFSATREGLLADATLCRALQPHIDDAL